MKCIFCIFIVSLLFACTVSSQHEISQPQNIVMSSYFTPSEDCENNIIHYISNSTTIDIAVYSITNKKIVDALISAYNKGVKIRIVSDKLQARGKHSLINELKQAGIPLRLNKFHKIEHNKFAVFDNKYVETGSYNWTTAATYHNSENCLFIKYPNSNYTTRFQYLWDKYE